MCMWFCFASNPCPHRLKKSATLILLNPFHSSQTNKQTNKKKSTNKTKPLSQIGINQVHNSSHEPFFFLLRAAIAALMASSNTSFKFS